MEAQIRLDNTGSPYLVLLFDESKEETQNAIEDAEKLFITQLKANGGRLHVYSRASNEKQTKVLLVTNVEKRGFYKLSDVKTPDAVEVPQDPALEEANGPVT